MEADKDVQMNRLKLIASNLYNSREEGQFGIVVLTCKDGLVLAHKWVLTVESEYFRGMFSNNNIENTTNVVSFLETSTEAMNIIIKFLYAEDLPTQPEITDTLIREILIEADKMLLKDLFNYYWESYSTSITLDNFFDVWQLAEMFYQDGKVEEIRTFVVRNMNEIGKTYFQPDITERQLESLADGLAPDKSGEFIYFLLKWSKSGTSDTEKKIQFVSNLISKCDISLLPDAILRSLLLYNAVVQTPAIYHAIYHLFLRQVASRWCRITEPKLVIHAFKITEAKMYHSVCNLVEVQWRELRCDRVTERWFPAVSLTGRLFWYDFRKCGSNRKEIIALDVADNKIIESGIFYDLNLDRIISETSSRNENYYKFRASSYCCFNTKKKTWRIVDFKDQISDCKCMLLATEDEKYFFDVDEKRIKIISRETCEYKKKLAGNWETVRSKSLCSVNSTQNLVVFFQKLPDPNLLIYNVEADRWNIVPMPKIENVVMLIFYDEDSLIFERETDMFYNIYSLKTKKKISEFLLTDLVFFDASFEM